MVGTHALVEEGVAFHDLALAVIDEQHRFGVAQREALGAKGIVAARPAHDRHARSRRRSGRVLHADLDVTDLRAAPAGRQAIATGIRGTGPARLAHEGRARPAQISRVPTRSS